MVITKHRVTSLSLQHLEFLLCTLESYYGDKEVEKIGREIEITKSKWDEIFETVTLKQIQDSLEEYKSSMKLPTIAGLAKDFNNLISDIGNNNIIIVSFDSLLDSL